MKDSGGEDSDAGGAVHDRDLASVDAAANLVAELQVYAAQALERRGYQAEPAQWWLLMLAEEVGELIAASRTQIGVRGNAQKSKSDLADEAADVLNCLLACAVRLDIDLADGFQRKERVNASGRRYGAPEI